MRLLLFLILSLGSCTLIFRPIAEKPSTWRHIADTVYLNDSSIRFGVIGDWGREGRKHQKPTAAALAKGMEAFGGQFMVSTGDNFYPAGVKSTKDIRWLTSYELIYHQQSLQKKWYTVPGNHDYIHGFQPEVDYSRQGGRWVMPAPYYQLHVAARSRSRQTAEADFFFIDTSPLEPKYYHGTHFYKYNVKRQDTAAQLRWLETALAGSRSPWKIVVGHHPLQSSGERNNVQRQLSPLLLRHGVQLYLCGHEHHLEISRLPGSGLLNVISGAGSELLPVRRPEKTIYAYGGSGFALVEVGSRQLETSLMNVEARRLFSIRKPSAGSWQAADR